MTTASPVGPVVPVGQGIIDFHCHIASDSFFPPSFMAGILDNLLAALEGAGVAPRRKMIEAMYLAKWQDPWCDQLIAEMDEAGIAQAVLLLPDFTFALRGCKLTIAEMVEHHRQVLERHPGRLRCFAGVDPRWGEDGLRLFEKAIADYGFHGMKLYPPCGYTPSDRTLYPFYEICARYGVPVLAHTGATSPVMSFEEARPIHVDRAARDFPGIDFVLAHGSVHYQDECAMLCSHRPNVFLDISGYEVADLGLLRSLFGRGVNHKILFGTDWPIFRMQGTQRDFVNRLQDGTVFPQGMSAMSREGVLFRNAQRILGKRASGQPLAAAGGG